MAGNASDGPSGAVIFGFLVAGLAAMTYVIFLIAAFITFVMTVFCIAAWNRPIGSGKTLIRPHEARAFVKRGVAGAFLLPLFLVFVEAFLSININWDYFFHVILAGYIGGSLVVQIMIGEDEAASPAPVEPDYRQTIDAQAHKALPPVPQPPFEFASWDDEDKRG